MRGALVMFAAAVLSGVTAVPTALAQPGSGRPLGGKFETRESLVALAKRADSLGRADDAIAIRRRLEQGDFSEGDRVVVAIDGDEVRGADGILPPALPNTPDTVVVRAGRIISMRDYAPLALDGVLRSELHAHIDAHVRKVLTRPTIRVVPLMRVGVLGGVARPSYYYLPVDGLLTDAIAAAGGYGGEANTTNIVIRRLGREIYSASAVRRASAEGQSLDVMNLEPGDEIVVGRRSATNWVTWLQLSLGVAVAVVGIMSARR
jgi:hypothetical protein